jgi:hypothetical protein
LITFVIAVAAFLAGIGLRDCLRSEREREHRRVEGGWVLAWCETCSEWHRIRPIERN